MWCQLRTAVIGDVRNIFFSLEKKINKVLLAFYWQNIFDVDNLNYTYNMYSHIHIYLFIQIH